MDILNARSDDPPYAKLNDQILQAERPGTPETNRRIRPIASNTAKLIREELLASGVTAAAISRLRANSLDAGKKQILPLIERPLGQVARWSEHLPTIGADTPAHMVKCYIEFLLKNPQLVHLTIANGYTESPAIRKEQQDEFKRRAAFLQVFDDEFRKSILEAVIDNPAATSEAKKLACIELLGDISI